MPPDEGKYLNKFKLEENVLRVYESEKIQDSSNSRIL
jgi:hypothetical protein